MDLNEFKDRLFDVLNETDNLPIQDIMVQEREDKIAVYLDDGTIFTVKCEKTGNWWIAEV